MSITAREVAEPSSKVREERKRYCRRRPGEGPDYLALARRSLLAHNSLVATERVSVTDTMTSAKSRCKRRGLA